MTKVYLASPNCQLQAEWVSDMPVLLSFACWSPWLEKWQASFDSVLIDSGAFSELTGNAKVDGNEYVDWYSRWANRADAIAGLDDIRGDWRRSLKNYELYGGFPTMHETDPPELLKDLVDISIEKGGKWLGLGLLPPRKGKEKWVRWACDNIPDDIHVHGFAMREYLNVKRLDSVDSTNWFRDALDLSVARLTKHLTPAECIEVVIKRYKRESLGLLPPKKSGSTVAELSLFD